MTKGWCPVHDRILESRDGSCPECGTPLIDLTARSRDAGEARLVVEEDSPPAEVPTELPPPAETRLWPEIKLPERLFGRGSIALGPVAIAAILVAAVITSFLVGLTIPRSRRPRPEADARPSARSEYRIGKESFAAGVRLRLETFSQSGRHVVLRMTVSDQSSIDIGRIIGVRVAPEVATGLVLDEVSLGVRTTVSGFIAEGPVFERDDQSITGIRIVQLEMRADGRGRAALDLSPVWPDQPAGPLASASAVRIQQLPGRSMRVVGLVGWPDHLEVQLEERNVPEGWINGDTFRILTVLPADGEVIRDRSQDRTRFTTLAFQACAEPAFQCVPRGLSRVTLVVDPETTTVVGRWAWEFT